MAWIYLIVAGLLEIGWAYGMKESKGLTVFWPTVLTGLLIVLSLALLNIAMKTLPLGTAYGVWTGIGTVGTVVVGILVLGESAEWPRLLCIALVICGVVGLRVISPAG